MTTPIFDFDDGDICFKTSKDTAIDLDGNMLIRLDDHVAMDFDSGRLHFTSSWSEDEEGEV